MGEALTQLLDRLVGGHELQDAEVGAFSDLDRDDAASIKSRWAEMDVATRALLLERAGELADVHLEMNFVALGQLALDDADPEVRERAVTTLWESGDRAVADQLAELALRDPGPGVRAAAALGLQPFVEEVVMGRLEEKTSERVVSALRAAVDDPDIDVRASALEAAGALPEEWVAEKILESYESTEKELRVAAIRAMGNSATERWIEYISDQLFSAEQEMRLEAVLAAGALSSDELVEPLGELLNDDDPEVILAVVEALGEIGGEEAIDLLTEFRPYAPEGLDAALETALGTAKDTGLFRQFGNLNELDERDAMENDQE